MLLVFFLVSTAFSVAMPPALPSEDSVPSINRDGNAVVAQSVLNLTIPYVDVHYGYADGIIDPREYATQYTDPATGITVYLEHNSTILYVGLSGRTQGWIALGWKSPNGSFSTSGLNGSDLIYGYAPGLPHQSYNRVTGSEYVTVHYKLYLRNGTLVEEGNAPTDSSTTPLNEERLLEDYKAAIIGMRIGEVRHFVIPAERGYTTQTHELYGEDLEYVIQLTRIGNKFTNPATSSKIIYRDAHGTSTFAHEADTDQSRIVAANASDTGTYTYIEYFIRMNSTDPNDIPLANATDVYYPFIFMMSNTEDFGSLPSSHSDWSNPLHMALIPNAPPTLDVKSPTPYSSVVWTMNIELNATDESIVRRAAYRIDNRSWTKLKYDFSLRLWTAAINLFDYGAGNHTVYLNATDASNATSVMHFNVTFEIPSMPLLGMRLTVSRTVTTLLYHETKISDQFVVVNNASAPINAIEYYIPRDYVSCFISAYAKDSENRPLRLVRLDDVSGMMYWRVFFYSPVGYNQTYTFTVTVHYHSLKTIHDFNNNIFQLRCPRYPLVPYVLDRASFSFALRSGETLVGTSPEGSRFYIVPMKYEPIKVQIKSYTPMLVADRVTTVTIDPWGWLYYFETITIQNIGPSKENTMSFVFPAYSRSIVIYDHVGYLSSSLPTSYDWNETLTQTVNLKNDRFGENGFMPGYKYTFFVKYAVLLDKYVKNSPSGNVLNLPLASLAELPVRTYTINLRVNTDVQVLSASGEYRLFYGAFDATLQYTAYNITKLNLPEITITYNLAAGILARPIGLSLIVAVVASSFVLVKKMRIVPMTGEVGQQETARTGTQQVAVPVELLKQFTSAYSRKLALQLELEKLEEAVGRKKVSKKEYLIRDRDLRNQLDEITSELRGLKQQMLDYGPKYRDVVAQLELYEEKIGGAKAGLAQLMQRKRGQTISRAAFEKARQEYLKTIKQAVAAIDRILFDLQEVAGGD